MSRFVFLLLLACVSCQNVSKDAVTNYDLQTPLQIWKLPKELDEISGFTMANNETLFCNNDEQGIIYTYNLEKSVIENSFTFGKNNDYEDVTLVSDSLFVLQSNGTLFCIDKNKKITKITTFLNQKQDTEGLCYDKKKHRLLLACKNKVAKKISIYGFDLKSNQLLNQPVISFSSEELSNKNFAPSGIAIHPLTETIFIISSVGKSMVEVDYEGKILNEYSLNNKHFLQPEGIFITQNGDLFISNEGKNKKANLLKFEFLQ